MSGSNPPILLQKSFWGGERKFLEPLMRFARGDVRGAISFDPKSITDLRSCVESNAAAEKLKDQLPRDFWRRSIFDFCNSIGH
jgi:hypothetical protein